MLEQLYESYPISGNGQTIELPDRAPFSGRVASGGTTLLPLGVMPVSGTGTNTVTNRNTSKSATLEVTAITAANPGVVTSTEHGLMTGDIIRFADDVPGMVQLRGLTVTVTRVDVNSFSIGINTLSFTAYTTNGVCRPQITRPHFQLTGIDTSNAVDCFKGWMLEITDARYPNTWKRIVGNTAANPGVVELAEVFNPSLPVTGDLTYRLWSYLLKPIVITVDGGATGTLTLYQAGVSGGTGANIAQIGKPLKAGESSDPIAIRRAHHLFYAFSVNAASEIFYWKECDSAVVPQGTLPSGAATSANQVIANTALAAIQTAVELIDNVVAGAEAQVDVITSALPTGASTAANQTTANTTLTAIQTAVELIDNMIAGAEAQVDVITSALPTGASTSANQTTEIGDLDALNSLAGAAVTVPTQITKTIAAIATPEALAADGTFFRRATLIGKKAARTNNVGIVYLGIGITNDTQALEINPNEVITIEAPPGEKFDLNDWGLDVLNAGDGVIIIYS